MNSLAFMVLVLEYWHITDALSCYQCADTRMDGECQTNIEGLATSHGIWKNDSKTITDSKYKPGTYLNYIKDCSLEEKYCVIERIEDKSVMFAYIRDCSDGSKFSVTDIPRFNGSTFNKNNFTSCAFKQMVGLVCITLCDNDLCNGPQIDISGQYRITVSSVLLFMSLGRILLF